MTHALVAVRLKTQIIEEVKQKATESGLTQASLYNLLLAYGLTRVSSEALLAHAAKVKDAKPKHRQGLRVHERDVLRGLEQLETAGDGKWRFKTAQIARSVGIKIREAYDALKTLEARGVVRLFDMTPEEVDRWDRPVNAFWHRITEKRA